MKELVGSLGITGNELNQLSRICSRLAQAFLRYGLTLAEINPLAQLEDGSFIALDSHCDMEEEAREQQTAVMDELGIGWLEEPFPAHDYRSYREARTFGRTPLAAGENHYTRFEFDRVIEDGAITILQPDLSKTGGITEALRIAAMASAWRITASCE